MSRGRKKKRYYWDGLQVANQAVIAAGSENAIIAQTRQEFMPSTLIRVRGQITYEAITATGNLVRSKLMYVEVNDASAMTGDHAAIDTHEEDIAVRQLWTYQYIQSAINTVGHETVEIDIKAKVKLDPAGKKLLVLLTQSTSDNRTRMDFYLRALTQITG